MAIVRWVMYLVFLLAVLGLGLLFGASRPELVDQIELPEPVEAMFPINVGGGEGGDVASNDVVTVVDDEPTINEPEVVVGKLDVKAIQGGFIRGRVSPKLAVQIADGEPLRSDNGGFFYAFDRDRIGTIDVSIPSETLPSDLTLAISTRDYAKGGSINTARSIPLGSAPPGEESDPMGFDDMFPEEFPQTSRTILPGGESLQDRKIRERDEKTAAIEGNPSTNVSGYLQDWIVPIAGEWRQTSPWGKERTLNGRPQVHAGADLAAEVGTPIVAPADGVVTLASTDFYFEGGVVFIDHGLGLTSMYLHMSEVDVGIGHVVKQGDKIGAVGSTGRSTGPHLCWRLHWQSRDVRVDPFSFVSDQPG